MPGQSRSALLGEENQWINTIVRRLGAQRGVQAGKAGSNRGGSLRADSRCYVARTPKITSTVPTSQHLQPLHGHGRQVGRSNSRLQLQRSRSHPPAADPPHGAAHAHGPAGPVRGRGVAGRTSFSKLWSSSDTWDTRPACPKRAGCFASASSTAGQGHEVPKNDRQ